MARVVLLNALYDQFTSFITELSQMYPEDPDFPMFLTSVRMLKMSNPSLLSKYIVENVSEYEVYIKNRDEQFFLTRDFETHGVDIDIVSKLKAYLGSMSEKSKEHVWNYCDNIIRLARATV